METDLNLAKRVGVVAIGRNEGERLRRCLDSLDGHGLPVVYVDSGSSDGSPEHAKRRGVHVVNLDLSRVFTAARARNEGFDALLERHPGLEFVFFVDGDCEVVETFIAEAVACMDNRRDLAVVCGRRMERFPEATIYNRLADMEWNTPIGEADSCGGDALMRTSVFQEENGYDASLVSGEEPELCLRIRRRGFKILRADLEMTIHDAAMTRLSQWWVRALRTGHAAYERLAMHGGQENPVHAKRARSAIFWAVAFPIGVFVLSFLPLIGLPRFSALALLPIGYAVLAFRIFRYRLLRGDSDRTSLVYSLFCVLAKFPEVVGMLNCAVQRCRGIDAQWIEYKDVEPLDTRNEQELPVRRSA